jgi:hypothetical protein
MRAVAFPARNPQSELDHSSAARHSAIRRRADQARAAHLMAKRGLNAAEIALRLGTTERNVIRLKNTDVEPCPTTTFHGSARTAKPSN